MNRMTIDQARQLINTYCCDEPKHDAALRLTEFSLEEFAQINEPGGADQQNFLDAILYSDPMEITVESSNWQSERGEFYGTPVVIKTKCSWRWTVHTFTAADPEAAVRRELAWLHPTNYDDTWQPGDELPVCDVTTSTDGPQTVRLTNVAIGTNLN